MRLFCVPWYLEKHWHSTSDSFFSKSIEVIRITFMLTFRFSLFPPPFFPSLRQCEFRCHISGCSQVFSTVEDYEHHYNMLHRHVCSSCQRSLPSARLLDIHIQEWHDSLFSILAERQDMVANIHAHKHTCTHTHYVAHSGLDLDQSMHPVSHSLFFPPSTSV